MVRRRSARVAIHAALLLLALGAGAVVAELTRSRPVRAHDIVGGIERARALPRPPAEEVAPVALGDGALGADFRGGRVITGATRHRLILFSFDDGPDKDSTPRLLDYLDEHRVTALFFLTAARIRGPHPRNQAQARIALDIVRRGHIVGSHTVDHVQLPLVGTDVAVQQIDDSERILTRVFGARPWLFRPPGGARSARIDELLETRRYTTVGWNLGAGDFQMHTAKGVLETWKRVFDRRERETGDRGGIVLLHDIHPWSVDAFPLILSELRRRNCLLLARGEELYDVVDDLSFFFTPRRPGEPWGTEAAPAEPDPDLLAARQADLRREARRMCP